VVATAPTDDAIQTISFDSWYSAPVQKLIRDKRACRALVEVLISPPTLSSDDVELGSADPREAALWVVYGICQTEEGRATLKLSGVLPPLYSLLISATGTMRDITTAILGIMATEGMTVDPPISLTDLRAVVILTCLSR